MKRRTIVCLMMVAVTAVAAVSCQTMNRNTPIEIGMPKKTVGKLYPFASDRYLLMTEPGQVSPAYDIVRENVRFVVAFDKHDRICRISPDDESFRLPNGIGLDSTFGDIKKQYENYKIISQPGYGIMVEVDNGIRFGFSWTDEHTVPDDNEKVSWIELQRFPLSE